jgi:hypothetical protein
VNAAAPFGSGEVQREVERRAHQGDTENADQGSGAGEGGRSQCEAAALLPEQIVPRRRDILEGELRHQMRAVADRVDCTLEHDAWGRRLQHRWDAFSRTRSFFRSSMAATWVSAGASFITC